MVGIFRKSVGFICLAIFLALSLYSLPAAAEGQGIVYVVPLEGDIDATMPFTIQQAFSAAEDSGADLIILEIDTFGGLVDASEKIKTHIYAAPVPVYAYVKKAISGGAYVALACERIYMQPGSTLGAVEPVSAYGPITDEKTLSVIEGQMRTMAERQGRDPQIAAAMVRKELEIPDVVERGKLLTLTANEAKKVGYAEGIVDSYSDIPPLAGISSPQFIEYTESWAVRFVSFLRNPVVGALLIGIGLAALAVEIFTAGFSGAGLIALAAFALFFGGNIILGVAQWEYIALFVVGLALIVAEAFVPGFGVMGISGIICLALSIILSAQSFTQGLLTLGMALLFSIVLLAIAFRFLRKSKLWNKIILSDSETKERGYVGPKDLSPLLGNEGVAVTPLRPSGTVRLANGQRVDAITEGGYIAVNTEVVITGTSSGSVVVAPK